MNEGRDLDFAVMIAGSQGAELGKSALLSPRAALPRICLQHPPEFLAVLLVLRPRVTWPEEEEEREREEEVEREVEEDGKGRDGMKGDDDGNMWGRGGGRLSRKKSNY